jgi:hypothetical protein
VSHFSCASIEVDDVRTSVAPSRDEETQILVRIAPKFVSRVPSIILRTQDGKARRPPGTLADTFDSHRFEAGKRRRHGGIRKPPAPLKGGEMIAEAALDFGKAAPERTDVAECERRQDLHHRNPAQMRGFSFGKRGKTAECCCLGRPVDSTFAVVEDQEHAPRFGKVHTAENGRRLTALVPAAIEDESPMTEGGETDARPIAAIESTCRLSQVQRPAEEASHSGHDRESELRAGAKPGMGRNLGLHPDVDAAWNIQECGRRLDGSGNTSILLDRGGASRSPNDENVRRWVFERQSKTSEPSSKTTIEVEEPEMKSRRSADANGIDRSAPLFVHPRLPCAFSETIT